MRYLSATRTQVFQLITAIEHGSVGPNKFDNVVGLYEWLTNLVSVDVAVT